MTFVRNQEVRCPQPLGTAQDLRTRGPALRRRPRCQLHQQPRRTRPPHEQGQAKGLRMLPHPKIRRGLLPHLKLPAIRRRTGIQPSGRNPDRPRRKRRQHARLQPTASGSASSDKSGRVVTSQEYNHRLHKDQNEYKDVADGYVSRRTFLLWLFNVLNFIGVTILLSKDLPIWRQGSKVPN